jgi:hypothetical protein
MNYIPWVKPTVIDEKYKLSTAIHSDPRLPFLIKTVVAYKNSLNKDFKVLLF